MVTEGPFKWLMRAYAKLCLLFASESEKVRYAAAQGTHYAAVVPDSASIDRMIGRLQEADRERIHKRGIALKERLKQLEREAHLTGDR